MRNRLFMFTLMVAVMAIVVLPLGGCSKAEEASEEAADAVRDAAEATGEAVAEGIEAAGEMAGDAGEAIVDMDGPLNAQNCLSKCRVCGSSRRQCLASWRNAA